MKFKNSHLIINEGYFYAEDNFDQDKEVKWFKEISKQEKQGMFFTKEQKRTNAERKWRLVYFLHKNPDRCANFTAVANILETTRRSVLDYNYNFKTKDDLYKSNLYDFDKPLNKEELVVGIEKSEKRKMKFRKTEEAKRKKQKRTEQGRNEE